MKKIIFAVAAIASLLAVQTTFAEDWAQKHPRRAEVVGREQHQKAVNNRDVRNGSLTRAQGHQLNKEDNAIRRQERADAAADGGHITKGEQRQLNREENAVNAQRRADIQSNKAGLAPAN